MKTLFISIIFFFVSAFLLAQTPVSLVGTYPRDVPDQANPTDYSKKFPPCFSRDVTGYSFTDYDGKSFPGLGEVSYYLASNNPVGTCTGTLSNVKRPIIILDGFDPGDSRSASKLYGVYLKYISSSQGTNSEIYLGNILRQGINGQTNQQYDVVVLNFPKYRLQGSTVTQTIPCPVPATVPNQAQICSQLGYPRTLTYSNPSMDIDGGADYVERNAFVLIKLIQETNQTLQQNGSSEPLVIIGPSMGGLISRYALAYMEKKYQETGLPEWKHNCRLWFSFDAPHQGANIGIGTQHFLSFFANNGIESAKRNLDVKIRSAAAKQMLLHHELSNSVIAQGAPNFRDKFDDILYNQNGLTGSFGFPQGQTGTAFRKIALINGSINGTTYGNACGPVLKLESSFVYRFLFIKIYTKTNVATANIYNAGGFGNSCQTFSGYKYTDPFKGSTWEDDFNTAPTSSDSYDIVPGGSFEVYPKSRTVFISG